MAARAFVSLEKRDADSLCPDTRYVSPSGLIFHTQCSQQVSGAVGDFYIGEDDESKGFEDCTNECGTIQGRCFAAVYHPSTGHCFFFNDSKSILGDNGDGKLYNVAIANTAQLTPPSNTKCTYKEGATYTTSSGLEFDITCDIDYLETGGDFCPDPVEDGKCHTHADSMEECMDQCSQSHPLCQGVTYNANLANGYGNCYFKRDPFAVTDPVKSNIAISAQIKKPTLYNIKTNCSTEVTENSYATDESSSKYSVSCYKTRIGSQNITSTHAVDLDACLNDCSAADACKGVVYDMSLDYGYENCYIQNSTGDGNRNDNAIVALRLSTGNESSNNPSEAWIAGPVIGAIIALILLVAIGLWSRKRKARRTVDAFEDDPKQPIYEKDSRKIHEKDQQHRVYEVGPGAHGPNEQRYELRDLNSEAMLQHEMPRSP